MNDNIQTVDYYVLPTAERNRVVRNTYWLLAISMLPTVLGAYVGVTTGISYAISGVMGMILMLAGVFGFSSGCNGFDIGGFKEVFGFHGKACLKSKKTPSIPTLKAPLPSLKTKETSIKVSYLAQGLETSKIHTI